MFEPESEINNESIHTEKYHQNACRIALVLAHKWERKNFRFNVTDRGNEPEFVISILSLCPETANAILILLNSLSTARNLVWCLELSKENQVNEQVKF